MTDEQRYEDDDYVETQSVPSVFPEGYYFNIRHKASGNNFRVQAKDRTELAEKVFIGDWEADPQNTPWGDEEEGEE